MPAAINFGKSRSAVRRYIFQGRHRKGGENKDEKKIRSTKLILPKSRLGSFVKQTVGTVI